MLPGDSDLNQLVKIFDLFGTPNDQNWPVRLFKNSKTYFLLKILFNIKNCTILPDYIEFKPVASRPLRQIFTAATPDIISLLEKMLTLNPSSRCTATDALQMEYFKKQPGPSAPNELPLPKSKRDAIKERSEQIKRKLSDNNDPTSKLFLTKFFN